MDNQTTIQELKDLVERFKQERGWGKHHTPKNLAMSIAIEAAELMEHFQWDDYSLQDSHDEEVAKELADIVIYCLNLSQVCGIDVAAAVRSKLKSAEAKYPVSKFNNTRDESADYLASKTKYRNID